MSPFLFDLVAGLDEEVDFFRLLAVALVDFLELELPPALVDLAELDFVAVDLLVDDFGAAVRDLEPALADLDLEVEPAFDELLFPAAPVLRLAEDLPAADLLAVDRLDEPTADFDFEAVDFEDAAFDAVDFLELDVERDFGFDELVDFLVVGILNSSSCK